MMPLEVNFKSSDARADDGIVRFWPQGDGRLEDERTTAIHRMADSRTNCGKLSATDAFQTFAKLCEIVDKPLTRKLQTLCSSPELDNHPAILAQNLDIYVSHRLREDDLDIYSAFLLAMEAARIRRFAYRQPAWPQTLSISGLLALLMLAVTARALRMNQPYEMLKQWFLEDIPLLAEKRQHFLVSRLHAGESLFDDEALLTEIAELRRDYDSLSDDFGPYPSEVFPWDYAAPEGEVLNAGSDPAFQSEQLLDENIGEILVELASGDFA